MIANQPFPAWNAGGGLSRFDMCRFAMQNAVFCRLKRAKLQVN
jgi:hypothetical protein